jgi:hypothetical protein
MLPDREKSWSRQSEVPEEEVRFLGIFLQKTDIGHDPVDLVNAHAPFDAAVHRVLLVLGKVMAGLGAQQEEDFFEAALGRVLKRGTKDEATRACRTRPRSFSGNSSTGATTSANPALMTLLGMLSNLAEAGS